MDLLRKFAYLQYARTNEAAKRVRIWRERMLAAAYEGTRFTPPVIDLSDRAMMRESMKLYLGTYDRIDDLKVCIVANETERNFITSDDPSIFTNRFHLQRLNRNSFGIASSGALLMLPLTNRMLLLCYDSGIYTIPDRQGAYVRARNDNDILAFNDLQYLKAADNLYFSDWMERERIEQELDRSKPNRPIVNHEIRVYIPEPDQENYTPYRIATEEERVTSPNRILNHFSQFAAPQSWFSKLKYRNSLRMHANGSAIGYVRRREWLQAR